MELYIFLTVLIKVLLYIGCFFTIGTISYRYCFQSQLITNKLHFGSNNTKLAIRLFASIGLLASGLLFAIKLQNLSGSFTGLFDIELISLLWQTSTGDAFLYRIIGFGAILFCCIFLWDSTSKISLILLLLASLFVLKSFSSVGHIHSLDSLLAQFLLLLHLLGLSLWIGILIPLYQLTRNAKSLEQTIECAVVFGHWAIRFVPVLLGAGVWLAYLLLGSWSALFSSRFGQLLLLKIGFVSLLLIFAALNKFFYVKKIREGQPEFIRHFHLSIKLELMLVGIIFYGSAMLTSAVSLPQ